MSLNLMTGYAGEPHITSADDGAVNAAIYGASKYVLNTGQKFAYELISNNLIKIKDGYAINQGRKIGQPIDDYEELTIDNGLQGVKRSDIIAIRYSKNPDTGIESAEFIVIKGTSGDDYKDPACQTGNIIQGDSVDDFPLYRVKIEGLTITAVEPMFDVLVSMEELQNKYNDILGSQDISKIGDGTVTGAIDSLNSKSTEIFTNSTYLTGNVSAVRRGNVVTLSYTADFKSGTPAGDLGMLFRLSDNFLPAIPAICMTVPNQNIQITVNKTGAVMAYNYGSALTSAKAGRFSISYVAN